MVVHALTVIAVVYLPDEARLVVGIGDHVDQVHTQGAIFLFDRGAESLVKSVALSVFEQGRGDEEIDIHPDRAGPVVVAELVIWIILGERSNAVVSPHSI